MLYNFSTMKEIFTTSKGIQVDIEENIDANSANPVGTRMEAKGRWAGIPGLVHITLVATDIYNGDRDDFAEVIGSVADRTYRQSAANGLAAIIARRQMREQAQESPKEAREITTKRYSLDELEAYMAKSGADDHAALLREGTPEA